MDFYLVWWFKNSGDSLATECYSSFLSAYKKKKRLSEAGFHAGIITLSI